jgi:hypothetical protein
MELVNLISAVLNAYGDSFDVGHTVSKNLEKQATHKLLSLYSINIHDCDDLYVPLYFQVIYCSSLLHDIYTKNYKFSLIT